MSIRSNYYSGISSARSYVENLIEPFRDVDADIYIDADLAQNGSNEFENRLNLGHRKRLSELFRIPTEILWTSGGLEGARKEGSRRGAWILVTIHDPSIFACQQMVRDIWNDNDVQAFIRESGTILMMLSSGSPEATRYSQYYPYDAEDVPHWALIDPRTGKRTHSSSIGALNSGSVVLDPHIFLNNIAGFIFDNPLDDMGTSAEIEAQNSADSCLNKNHDDHINNLEQAIGTFEKKRDETSKTNDIDGVPHDLQSSLKSNCGKNTQNMKRPVSLIVPSESLPSKRSASSIIVPEEPSVNDPSAFMIQIRLLDGRRVRRRFFPTDTVESIFSYVQSLHPENSQINFDILEHDISLSKAPDSATLSSLNLNKATLTVVPESS